MVVVVALPVRGGNSSEGTEGGRRLTVASEDSVTRAVIGAFIFLQESVMEELRAGALAGEVSMAGSLPRSGSPCTRDTVFVG